MAFDVGTAVAHLELDLTAFNASIDKASGAFGTLETTVDRTSSSLSDKFLNIGYTLDKVGTSLTNNVTKPLVDFGKSAIDSYRSYESAFTGVKKTLSVTEEAMKDFGGEMGNVYDFLDEAIYDMTQRTASSAEEIAATMEVAGQLGVELGKGGEGLVDFTEIMIKLGDTTNLSAEEAAGALARFMNITGTAMVDVDRLGATIVDLGNNFETDENQIVRMATRLASAGTIAGLTERDILALSTAMASAGINAEAGGSAMSQTLAQIEKAVQQALVGDEGAIQTLETLAMVSNMSADEFSNAWLNDPMTALTSFLYGIGQLEDKGESTVLILDELGMTGIRQGNMLKALGLASEVLADAVDTSNKAWEDNLALDKEAALRYETLDSRISRLTEQWNDMKREIAEILLPVLEDLMEILRELIDWWKGLSDEEKENIVHLLEFAAVLGPALSLIGKLASFIGLLGKAFGFLSPAIGKVTGGLGKIGPAVGTAGGKLAEWWAKIKGWGAGLGSFAGKVGTWILEWGPKIGGWIGLIGGGIANLWGFIDQLQNGFSWLSEGVRSAGVVVAGFSAALLGVPGAVAAIGAAVVWLVELIIIHWDEIVEWLGDAWDTICEWFSDLWDWLSDFFSDLWDWLGDFFSDIGDWLADVWDSVSEWFSDLWDMISEWFGDVWDTVSQAVGDLWDTISEWFSDLWEMVSGWFDELWESLEEFVADIWDSVKEFVAGIWDSIKEFFANIWDAVDDFFANIWEALEDFVDNIWDSIQQFIEDGIEGIGDFFQNIWDSITQLFEDVKNAIADFFGRIWDAITGFFADIVEKVKNFVSDVWNKITGFFKDIWDKITGWFFDLIDWFKSLPGKLFDIGKDLLNGLWDGIKSVWDKFTGWLSDGWDWITDKLSYIPGIGGLFGSHKAGLDRVPFDGYVAQLHEGEKILTKQEADQYDSGRNSGSGDVYNFYNTKPDPYEYARQMKRVKREIQFG